MKNQRSSSESHASSRHTLWSLLSRASHPAVSENFVQDVSEQARHLRQLPATPTTLRPGAWVGLAAAALLVITLTLVQLLPSGENQQLASVHTSAPATTPLLLSDAAVWTDEMEVITLLDTFLAVKDPTELDDSAIAELLF
ncbi:MAG: hypothetical protein AAF191_01150 [Verrucomicrobiota bacterium]